MDECEYESINFPDDGYAVETESDNKIECVKGVNGCEHVCVEIVFYSPGTNECEKPAYKEDVEVPAGMECVEISEIYAKIGCLLG